MNANEQITCDELAQICGLAYRTVRRRLREGNVRPVIENGRGMLYDRQAAIAAIELGDDDMRSAARPARERLDAATARLREIEVQRVEGSIVELEAVDLFVNNLVDVLRVRARAIADQPDIADTERSKIRAHVDAMLEEIASLDPASLLKA